MQLLKYNSIILYYNESSLIFHELDGSIVQNSIAYRMLTRYIFIIFTCNSHTEDLLQNIL